MFKRPPLPSEYIGRYLSGEIGHDEFASNIGDGWIGSDFENRDWLNQLFAIERRYNPDFPSLALSAFTSEDAKTELTQLMVDLRTSGH